MINPSQQTTHEAIVIVTGLSGVGKTSALNELRKQSFPGQMADLDELEGAPSKDDQWRRLSFANFLAATFNDPKPILFGQIPVDEIKSLFHASKINRQLSIIILKIDEATRRGRLSLRGWSTNEIEAHAHWALHNGLFEQFSGTPGIVELDTSGMDVSQLGRTLSAILSNSQSGPKPPSDPQMVKTSNQMVSSPDPQIIGEGQRRTSDRRSAAPLLNSQDEHATNNTSNAGMSGSQTVKSVGVPKQDSSDGRSSADDNRWRVVLPNCSTLGEVVQAIKARPALTYADIYHPIPFPEFSSLRTPISKIKYIEKVRWIAAEVCRVAVAEGRRFNEVSVLDIGCNAGALCMHLSAIGFRVAGCEPDEDYLAVAKKTSNLVSLEIDWSNCTLGRGVTIEKTYDVVTILSVFQWVVKAAVNLEAAGKLLLAVSQKSRHMIFELGFNSGDSCLKTDDPDHFRALLQLLTTYTRYTEFKLLGISGLYPQQPRYVISCTGSREISTATLDASRIER